MAAAISSTDSAGEDARWVQTIREQRSAPAAEECYAKLLRKYWRLVSVLAVSRIGDRREAEDVCQEAFLRAFRSLEKLSHPVAFLGWLLRIARNVITDHLRSRKPHLSLDVLGEVAERSYLRQTSGTSPDFERELEDSEELQRALGVVAKLPAKYREVVALKYLHGLDGKTMARVLGEPEGTVRNRLFRALEKLRESLERPRAEKP